jgi:beta-galactosidase/beta-glucuronidase
MHVQITNEYQFLQIDRSRLHFDYSIICDGVAVAEYSQVPIDDVVLAPQQSKRVSVRIGAFVRQHPEVHLVLRATTASDEPWARTGHEVARQEFTLSIPCSQQGIQQCRRLHNVTTIVTDMQKHSLL